MPALQDNMQMVGGVEIHAEAVKLVCKGYARVGGALHEARQRGFARASTTLADVIRRDGVVSAPALLTHDERRRFEELTQVCLPESMLKLIWVILENEIKDTSVAPAAIPMRNSEVPGIEIRLVPWW